MTMSQIHYRRFVASISIGGGRSLLFCKAKHNTDELIAEHTGRLFNAQKYCKLDMIYSRTQKDMPRIDIRD